MSIVAVCEVIEIAPLLPSLAPLTPRLSVVILELLLICNGLFAARLISPALASPLVADEIADLSIVIAPELAVKLIPAVPEFTVPL